MRRSWRRFYLWVGIVVFIALNLFLIQLDDAKVDHMHLITKWKQVERDTIVETLHTEGLLVPAETHFTFIDTRLPFKQFFVNEGDDVEIGTPLFVYDSQDIADQLALLDAEMAKLEEDEKSIESLIDELERMKFALPPPSPLYYFADEEEADAANRAHDEYLSIEERSLELDQAMAEYELEREKIRHALKMYEAQREIIESGRDGLTVVSSFEGIVKHISVELQNPIITIASEDTVVKGRLLESQVGLVDEGMRVHVASDYIDEERTGVVQEVDRTPTQEPTLASRSEYEFTAEIDEPSDELYVGYHLDTEIVLDEAIDVEVVHESNIHWHKDSPHLWVLGEDGFISKRPIETGLAVDSVYELTQGIEENQLFVNDPTEVTSVGRFVTPFDLKANWQDGWRDASFRKY